MAQEVETLDARGRPLVDQEKWKEASQVLYDMETAIQWGHPHNPKKTPIREKVRAYERYLDEKYKEKTGKDWVMGAD